MTRTRTAVALVAATALGAALASPGLATAAVEASKDVIVRNTTASPVPTKAVGTTPVSGTVDVGNLPATQQVAGTVDVGNLPATQQVAGSVSVDNLPATQQVAGSVAVSNLPATQQVAGTVGIAGPVTVAQAQPQAFTGRLTEDSPGSATQTTQTYFVQVSSFGLPAGQTLTARSFSAQVFTPSDDCRVEHVSLRRLLPGGATGPALWSAATQTGPQSWVVNEEALLPDTRGIGTVVVCDAGTVGSASLAYVVTGDVVTADATP